MSGQRTLRTRGDSTGSFRNRATGAALSSLHPAPPVANADPSNQRRLPRKQVLLKGVVTDVAGTDGTDCAIADLNVLGAQVRISRQLSVGAQIILLDTSNTTAHIANVVWSNAERAGLSFVQSHAMGLGLPPRLNFLWKLLLEAKLKDISRVIARGAPNKLAASTVGLTEGLLHCIEPHASADAELGRLLAQASRVLES